MIRYDTLHFLVSLSRTVSWGRPRPPRITAGYHTFCDTAGDTVHDTSFVISQDMCWYEACRQYDTMLWYCSDMFWSRATRLWYVLSDMGNDTYDIYMIHTWYAYDTHMTHKCIFVQIFVGILSKFLWDFCEQVPLMTLRAYLMYQTHIIYISNCITCVSDASTSIRRCVVSIVRHITSYLRWYHIRYHIRSALDQVVSGLSYCAHIAHFWGAFGVLVGWPLGGVRIMSVSCLYHERAVIVVIRCVSCVYRVCIVCVSDGAYRVCLWYVSMHILVCIRSVSCMYHICIVWPSRVVIYEWYQYDTIRYNTIHKRYKLWYGVRALRGILLFGKKCRRYRRRIRISYV
jgi:hypothetical protein